MSDVVVDRPRLLADLLIVACVAGLLALSIALQSQVLVNHDVGWVLNSSGWLLDGARFGRDIVAANPPLIWWLSLPASAVSRLTGIDEVTAFRAFIWALCLWSLWICHRVIRPLRDSGRRLEHAGAIIAAALALLILPGAIFGQREHIAIAVVLPYALLAAMRMQGFDDTSRRSAAVIGLAAGVGFALKPYFLIIPVLLAIELAATRRSFRMLFATEGLAAALAVIACAVMVLVLTPDYLEHAVPLFRSIYWGFENGDPVLLYRMAAPGIWLTLLALAMALLTRSSNATHVALVTVSIGFLVAYWLQRKGYEYHAYPVLAVSVVLIAVASAAAIEATTARLKGRSLLVRVAAPATIVAVLVLSLIPRIQQVDYWYSWWNVNYGPMGVARVNVINAVRSLVRGPGDCVFAFSTHPYPGFPTMNYVDAHWGARSNSQFAIPAIIHRRMDPTAGQPHDLAAAERYTREAALDDFRRCPPGVVMVITSTRQHGLGLLPYDAIEFFNEDPRFAAIWATYREIGTVGGVRFFVPLAALRPVGQAASR